MHVGTLEVKLEGIDKKLDRMEKKLSFVDDLIKAFECIVCHSTVKLPVVAPCCQRCGECVQTWLLTHTHCPLCSVTGRMTELVAIKGMDDLTGFFRVDDDQLSRSVTIKW